MTRVAAALVSVAVFLSGCATAPDPDAGSDDVVERLLDARRDFEGARGLAKVRLVEANRTLDAGFRVGGDGKLELSVMSPFGTSLATLFSGDGSVMIVNRSAKTWWEGRAEDLEDLMPLRGVDMEGLGYLMAGLPPHADGWRREAVGERAFRLTRGAQTLLVLPEGIASVSAGSARARLDLPSMPPSRVVVLDEKDEEQAVIEIERLALDRVELKRPETDSGYIRVDTWFAVLGR